MKNNVKTKLTNVILVTLFFILISIFFTYSFKKSIKLGNIAHELVIFSKQPFLLRGIHDQNLKNIPNFFINFFKSFFIPADKNLKKITINIKFKNYKKILDDITTGDSLPYNIGYIDKKSSVKGTIVYNNNDYKTKIRIKGDRGDHWNRSKTHSLKFNLSSAKTLNSMQSFSIMKFGSRQFPALQIISNSMSRMGLIVQKFDMYDVVVNGDNWGLMYAEEEISPTFQEIRNLKEVPIVRYTVKDHLKLMAEYGLYDDNLYKLGENLLKRKEINIFNEKKYIKGEEKLNLNKNIINLHKSINYYTQLNKGFNDKRSEFLRFFDIEQFSKIFAFELVFGAFHALEIPNILFYYNIYEGIIQPIPTDMDACFYYKKNCEYKTIETFRDMEMPEMYYFFIESDIFKKYFKNNLALIRKDLTNISNDLNILCKNFIVSECKKNFSLKQISNNLYFIEKNLDKIFEIFRKNKKEYLDKNYSTVKSIENNLNTNLKKFIFENIEKFFATRIFDNGKVEFSNLSSEEITIKKISFFNKKKEICSDYNLNKTVNRFEFLEFKVDNLSKNCFKEDLYYKIQYFINGKIYSNERITIPYYFSKENLTDNSENLNFLLSIAKLNNNNFYIKTGNYDIDRPIIVPEGFNLIIESGTTLNFAENTYILLLKGSVFLNGSLKNKIKLLAKKNSWGGIFVRYSKNSEIKHTIIDKTNFFNDYKNMIFLTGGITFYKSNVTIDNSVIKNSNAEDAINFVYSNFVVKNTAFLNSRSDAIDTDYSKGNIINSTFSNIGGDAIDTSGSEINISKVKIYNIKDKGISSGENSSVNIKDSLIENTKIGMTAKDNSVIKADNIELNNNKNDLGAYLKKPMYLNGGKIYAKKIKKDVSFLKDEISLININNQEINKTNFKYKNE